MKRIFFGTLLFFVGLTFCAAAGITEDARRGNERADLSYAFGMLVGSDLADTGLEFNYDAFMRGMRDTMENEPTRFTLDEAMEIINIAFIAAQRELIERNRVLGEAFLAENRTRPEVNVTPSGLQYEVITEGAGDMPGPWDVVLVHYLGTTIDGEVFDTTYDWGSPVEIPLDRVIPGWAEGLRTMREGGKSIFYIPPSLAYGERGAGAAIGPNSVLIFEVELVSILQSFLDTEIIEDEWQSLLDDY
jgi:FKBP-type peptidyl-prolyl cis-trans isomerase